LIKIFLFILISIYITGCGNSKNIHVKKIITDKPLPVTQQKKRTHFHLYVQSPNATRIRILNIKPKYKDGIFLKKGRYHIETSARKYITYKTWIDLQKDTNLTVTLKQKRDVSMGFFHWREIKNLKYIDGVFWQDQAINKQIKMNWKRADIYCKNLRIAINKNIIIDDFRLPSEKELLKLRNYNILFDYSESIYWSASTDKEHKQFAKYIYSTFAHKFH